MTQWIDHRCAVTIARSREETHMTSTAPAERCAHHGLEKPDIDYREQGLHVF